MDSESNSNCASKSSSDEDCVLVEDADKTVDESNLNTTLGDEISKLAAKTPVSQTKIGNKNGELNKSVTNSCERMTKDQKMQFKMENAKKKQEEKEKRDREKREKEKEKEELKAKQEEERKRKKEEEEKLRQKRLEEKEKQNQERLEKERKRQEQINMRNEEKRKKEEERKKLEEEKKRLEEEKLKEEEEKRRKADKVKSQFASFFIKKDMPQTNQTDREEFKNLRFMPFQLKENMHLAPICRHIEFSKMNQEQREEFIMNLDSLIQNDESSDQPKESSDYLKFFKQNAKEMRRTCRSTRRRKYSKLAKTEIKTDETSNDEIKLIENIEPTDAMTEYRVKYLHFDPKQYRRPPYFGTWRKKSKIIRARNPFAKDEKLIDYEIDSDDEWEDEADGESIADSDKGDMEEETVNGDDDDDDGFFVPHGHLSDDELDEEERNLDDETKKAREEAKNQQYEMERKKVSKYLVPKCFFLNEYWNVPDKIDLESARSELKQLNKYQMVPLMTPLPIVINHEVPSNDKKNDESKSSKNANSDNVSSPNPTPKSKSNKQAKQNLNNSTQSPSSTAASASNAANNKGSIIKFISKISNKTCKIEQIANTSTSSETASSNNITTNGTTENNTNTNSNVNKTTDSIVNKNTPTAKLKKGNSSVILRQGSPSTPLNTKNSTNTSTTAEKKSMQ